jgi:hypothetical protein
MTNSCLNCQHFKEVSLVEAQKLRKKDADAKFGTCFQSESTMVYLNLEYISHTQAFEDCPIFKEKKNEQ